MIFILMQMGLCLMLISLAASLVETKWIKGLICFLGSVFIGLQTSSILLGNSLIDYKYYAHINLDVVTEVGGFFLKENAISFGVFLGAWWLTTIVSTVFRKMFLKQRTLRLLLIGLMTGLMFLPNGILDELFSIGKIHLAKQKQFSEAVNQLGFNNYTSKNDVAASAGKNIIAVFMESVEYGYLQENLGHLTPNLRRLAEEMSFVKMKQNQGSDYTIGAIYTYFTGFPMFFKHHGNDIFEETIDLNLPSITHALDKAGYHQEYIAGNPKFAGADVMMNIMDVKSKSEKDFDSKYAISHWGLHDKDLFTIIDGELDRLYEKNQPFAYYISTISTHATDGVFDDRMAKQLPPQKSQLELMVMALDLHIGELVDKLESQGRLENTSIFIMPDHLLMGKTSRVFRDFKEPRELFLITNSLPEDFGENEFIHQFDVPKILLEGAQVEHNLIFLTDIIEGDKSAFIKKNKQKILQLNEAALVRKAKQNVVQLNENEKIELIPDKVKLISQSWANGNEGKPSLIGVGTNQLKAKRGINLLTLSQGKYHIEYFDTFEKEENVDKLLKRLEALQQEQSYFLLLAHDSVGEHIVKKGNEFMALGFPVLAKTKNRRAYLGHSNYGYVSESSKNSIVKETFPFIPRKTYRSIKEMNQNAKDVSRFIAHAGGAIDGHTYTNSLEALNASYQKGFRWFELDIIKTSDGKYVAAHDWNQWRDKTKYGGDVPVDLETFKSKKVLGKYTSMDMKMINDWFAAHPDAILVTDKINSPKIFVEQFIDPSRLVMELFSFEAIKEAQGLNIKEILLSEGIWDQLGGDKLKGLQNHGLTGMAISIHTINAHRTLFKELKDAGIKVYAFHIGNHALKDESYMVREGLDFCHGLYADEWQF